MSDEKPHELLIIKRVRGGHDGHHGGAWKIAFADFMTAMMALFLVLWLISATSEKTKVSIARYFNPVKLVDLTTMKKGVSDPNDNVSPSPDPAADSRPNAGDRAGRRNGGADTAKQDTEDAEGAGVPPTRSEAALFRDPYAVLAEIAAGRTDQANKPANGTEKIGLPDSSNDPAEPFKDPFKLAIPDVLPNGAAADKKAADAAERPAMQAPQLPNPAPNPAPTSSPAPTAAAVQPDKAAPAAAAMMAGGKPPAPAQVVRSQADTPHDAKQVAMASAAEVTALQAEVASELAKLGNAATTDKTAPALEIKASEDGILISLTDRLNYAMFAIGSAEPQKQTVLVMEKIAGILKKHQGGIVIRGHTDARPYKGTSYDNWRLSTARAQMAEYMLIRGGLDEKRVLKIEGYADHMPKDPKDPLGAENRRIEILLRKDRP